MEQIIAQIQEYVPIAQVLSTFIAAISVGFAAFGIFKTLKNNQRQTNSQIFLDCVKRYEKILESFPPKVWLERYEPSKEAMEESGQVSMAVLRYLNLCSEEFYLKKQGYFSEYGIGGIWENVLNDNLSTPLLIREWKKLKTEFKFDKEFTNYIDVVQKDFMTNLSSTGESSALTELSILLERIKNERGEKRSLLLKELLEKEEQIINGQPEEKDKYLSLVKQKYLTEEENPTRREMLWRQYNLYTDLYKYYFDIALKANGFFYLVTGGILTYFLTHTNEPYIRLSLLLPIILSIGLGVIFIYGSRLVPEIRDDIFAKSEELALKTAPEFRVLNLSLLIFGAIFFVVAISLIVLMRTL